MKKSAPASRPRTASSSDAERIPQPVSENIHNHVGYGRPSRYIRSNWRQTGRVNRQHRKGSKLDKLCEWLKDSGRLFTVKLTDLDPSLSDDPVGRFDEAFVDRCFQTIRQRTRGPFHAVLEVGKGDYRKEGIGRLHVHIMAHAESGLKRYVRTDEGCKPIHDFWGLLHYLNKAEPYSLSDHHEFSAAKILSKCGRLPKLRRTFCGPQRLAWAPPLHYGPNTPRKIRRSPLLRKGTLEFARERELARLAPMQEGQG